jgi:hypothetical protein
MSGRRAWSRSACSRAAGHRGGDLGGPEVRGADRLLGPARDIRYPGVVRTPLRRPPDKLDVVCRVHHPPDAIPNIRSDGIRRCQYGVDSDHPHERGTEDDRFRTHEISSLGSPYSNSGMAYSWLVPHIAGRNPHECLTRPCCSEEDEIWWSLWGKRVPLWVR